MPRSIRPFTVSQAEPRTPLSIAPYRSRDPIHFFNEDADEKNYKYVAFRPGYAVQAAELNEIQSYMAKENTLFATMVSEWGYYVGKPYVVPATKDIVVMTLNDIPGSITKLPAFSRPTETP